MKLNKAIINSVNYVWSSKNLISTLLLPLAYITKAVVKRKAQKYKNQNAWHPNVPVIVVGNIYVGGTGKTPVVIELVNFLKENGYKPAVISRGYGVKANKQAMVGTHPLNPKVFGDEPSLIAQETNVTIAVHPQRVKAAQALLENNPEIDVIVMDDGLQHLKIARDIEIIVQDKRGVGNGRLLPAGPLREAADKLQNVDIIINNDFDAENIESTSKPTTNSSLLNKPINTYMNLHAYSAVQLNSNKTMAWSDWLTEYSDKNIAAMAGIGNPSRFFSMLEQDLKNIKNTYPLPDHAKTQEYDFKNLSNDIVLITSKDAIKCKHINDERIWVVKAQAKFNNDLWLQYVLDKLNHWNNHANQIT